MTENNDKEEKSRCDVHVVRIIFPVTRNTKTCNHVFDTAWMVVIICLRVGDMGAIHTSPPPAHCWFGQLAKVGSGTTVKTEVYVLLHFKTLTGQLKVVATGK